MASNKSLDLFKTVLPNLDKKNKRWYDTLSSSEKKEISNPWTIARWMSSVSADFNYQHYYLKATNEYYNTKVSAILKEHPKLAYLLLTTVSPGAGVKHHKFINPYKGKKGTRKKFNLFQSLFPELRDYEIEIMIEKNSDSDIKEYLMALGKTDKEIKKLLDE